MIQPRLLAPGDRVAIVAPAGSVARGALDQALGVLEAWGVEIVMGRNVYGLQGYFSGSDEERFTDVQNALDDPTIAAILFARGGYGTTRILDSLQLDNLLKSPKWLIGFSDLTALHLLLLKHNLQSVHGDVGTTLGRNKESTEALHRLLFQGNSSLTTADSFRSGVASGVLTGGNLALIVDSLGTSAEIDTNQKILFLEEIGEKAYRVDRMLYQLLRAGKLSKLAALVVGQFTGITEEDIFGATWKESLERVVSRFNYPVAFGFPFGHQPENYPLIHGANYHLVVEAGKATLDYKPA